MFAALLLSTRVSISHLKDFLGMVRLVRSGISSNALDALVESDLAEPRVALTYDLDEHVCLFVNWFAEYISDFFDLHVALSVDKFVCL